MSGQLPTANTDVQSAVITVFYWDDFQNVVQLEPGGEAVTFKVNTVIYGEICAKVFNYPVLANCRKREVETLLRHSFHPNVVKFIGFLNSSNRNMPQQTGYVMEYMPGGSLHSVIHSKKMYSLSMAYSWIAQASRGLQYLHNAGIVHRDIKPRNMLLNESLKDLKLADFGLAKDLEKTQITGNGGTPSYMAPEVHKSSVNCGKEVDVYSLAISMWEIFHRRYPYRPDTVFAIASLVVGGMRPKIELEVVGEKTKDIIERSWLDDPSKRPSMIEIINFADEMIKNIISREPSEMPPKLTSLPPIDVNAKIPPSNPSLDSPSTPKADSAGYAQILQKFQTLTLKDCFVGRMNRTEAESLLSSRGVGDFFVRESDRCPGTYVISVVGKDQIVHFNIVKKGEHYTAGDGKFPSMDEVLQHFTKDSVKTATGEYFLTRTYLPFKTL